jgi:hypothetical protein
MVHAYLMYGFPTQTAQETIDSLDMVRQLFKAGVLQSAFWHQFAMTAHSPVGLDPEKYKVTKDTEVIGTFANNDIVHHDPTGADHDAFGYGLKKSLFNYMHHIGLEEPLHKWFDFKVPKTSVDPQFIEKALNDDELPAAKPNSKIVWLGKKPSCEFFTQSKKGMQREMATVGFTTKTNHHSIQLLKSHAEWLLPMLEKLSIDQPVTLTLKEVMDSYEAAGLEDFELFWDNKPMNGMAKMGLLKI